MRRKCPGLKSNTEAMATEMLGRGASYMGRSHTVRSGGLYRSENAGMSSERMVRIHSVENLRIPEEGSSAQGKSGPKERRIAYPMDNRLIFRYHQASFGGSSDTGG
jgi:hypothetical protein